MSSSQSRSTPPTAAGSVRLRQFLGDSSFRLYLIGQTTSGLGSSLSTIALVFAVMAVSRHVSGVGLVLLASRLPGVFLTLAGGIAADRWSRQRIAVCADAVRAAVQAMTGVLLLSGHATVIALAGLQFIAGGASAIFSPAAGALAATIAPGGELRKATSLLGITTAITQTGGLAVSGLIVALTGPGLAFVIDSATFAVSSVTIALITVQTVPGLDRKPILKDLLDGWSAFTSHNWLVLYAVHETAVNVLALCPFFVLGPVIAKDRLGGAPAWSAIALGYVLGNLAAAHVTYRWAPRRPVLAAVLMSAALAPMLALLGFEAPIWIVAPAAFLAGAQATIYNTLINSTIQANLPSAELGRGTSFASIGSTVLVPVGMGLAGIAAGAFGKSAVLLASAGLVVAATLVCTALPAVRTPLMLDRRG